MIAQLLAQGADLGEHLNADEIALTLQNRDAVSSARAQEIVRERRDAALAEGRDYSWETVMSHPSHLEHLQLAREAGYEIRLFYVATEDPRVSIGRVSERVARGGHDVPQDRIIQRYHRSIEQLPRAILSSDHARIFDNSSATAPLQLIARLDGNVFETPLAFDDLPLWFRPTILEMYRHRA
jgi:predicted ABC-type ATPase